MRKRMTTWSRKRPKNRRKRKEGEDEEEGKEERITEFTGGARRGG